jgi:PPK2 family polyphosphate:nucleotide phosphotransferase
MVKEKKFQPDHKPLKKIPTNGLKMCKLEGKDLDKEIQDLGERLGDLQELIFAEGKHKILIILQGLDTSGKDGTVKHVFSETNPQGLRVISFKEPSDFEKSHDYLWRTHLQLPRTGEMVIFNRSYYEDYIIPRVHQTLPKKQVEHRLEQINNFEDMLVAEGITVFKFFLHISLKEQAVRIQARLDNPKKHWKFSLSDLTERQYWNKYQDAYDTVLHKTHHKNRPWDIIPADDKKVRNYEISSILVERLEKLNPKFPEMNPKKIKALKAEAKKILRR